MTSDLPSPALHTTGFSAQSDTKEASVFDTETFTLEQYLALDWNDTSRGIKIPEIGKISNLKSKIRDSRGQIPGLTAVKALESIKEMVDHSHKWHDEESDHGILKPPRETPIRKVETFAEKVEKRIIEDQVNGEKLLKKLETEPFNTTLVKDIQETPKYTRHLKELVSNKTKIKELSMVKLNARCLVILQNKLSPKENDPRSFVLPCIIGNTTVSNALVDLGESINVMPFSMFKRLGLRNPRLVNMVIEMVDRYMQSPKGIVENVLVKFHKFIFLVDFIILDIIEEDKVPIILGRAMLATAHARIDVFGGKILLEVGRDQIVFNANEGATPDLEELLMNDDINGDLGNFLQNNKLLPNFDGPGAIPFSPNRSPSNNQDLVGEFQDAKNKIGIGIDDFIEIDYLWDDLDLGTFTNEQSLKPE
ncbi:retrovirus-related pol polyprotein from transposon TNT 1-94 [Tanacetum coccineum]